MKIIGHLFHLFRCSRFYQIVLLMGILYLIILSIVPTCRDWFHDGTESYIYFLASQIESMSILSPGFCPKDFEHLHKLLIDCNALHPQASLLDAWETPFRLDVENQHASGQIRYVVRSAGPDKVMYTKDDIAAFATVRAISETTSLPASQPGIQTAD